MAKKIKYNTGGPKGKKKSKSNKWWDGVQNTLTVGGMTPGWGIVPDLINTGISGIRTGYNYAIGDKEAGAKHAVNTGINASTMIPIAGQGVATAKLASLLPAVVKTGKEATKKTVKKNIKKKVAEETKPNAVVKWTKDQGKKVYNKGKNVAKKTPGFLKSVLWDGKRKWATIGSGVGSAVWEGYKDWKIQDEDRKTQEYIEANEEVGNQNDDAARRYAYGGPAPSMESVKESVSQGKNVYLSGGTASPIVEGSDAIEYTGQSHEQHNGANSGIVVDNAEVENGETQDEVTMRKGGAKKDYFFSSHLKKGGIPISEWHKDIVKNGDSQQAKDALAREQEIIAGRDPNVIAKKGGFMKYAKGGWLGWQKDDVDKTKDTDGDGTPDYQDNDLDGDGIPNSIDRDPNTAVENEGDNTQPTREVKKEAKNDSPNKKKDVGTFNAYGENYNKITDAATGAGYTGGGEDGSYRAEDLGDEGISNRQRGTGKGYYGEVGEANMTDFYNRNEGLLKEMGINSADEFNPEEHTKQFQEKYNENLNKIYDNDPDLQKRLDEQGISKEDYIKQSGFHGDGATGIDGKMGEFTWSKTSMAKGSKPTEKETNIEKDETTEEITTQKTETREGRKRWGDGVDLSMLQFLPAAVALTDKPDYMADPDVIVPPVVRAERIKADKIGMVNFNPERAALDMDAANFDRFVETSGGGMSNMANKMANQSSKFKKRMAINAQETKANVDIEGKNVANKLNADATNQTKALEASTVNAKAQLAADQENLKNKMYVDEFNRGADAATFDRKLNALDTMVGGAMEMQMAREKNRTDLEIAHVMDGNRDALERYQGETTTTKTTSYDDAEKHLRELLKKQGVKEGSDEWNKYIT